MKRWILAMVLVLGAAGTAAAQPGDDAAQARALFAEGDAHFALAEYGKAIAAFKESYRITRAPLLLYNIAQAYRLAGDCTLALRFYRNYLREDPQGPMVAKANERVPEMTACADKEDSAAASDTGAPVGSGTVERGDDASSDEGSAERGSGAGTAAAVDAGVGQGAVGPGAAANGDARDRPHAPATRSAGRGLRLTGLVTVGLGVALGAGAVYYGLDARDANEELEAACKSGCEWSENLASIQARGDRADRNLVWFSVGGAASVAVGVGLYYLGNRSGRKRAQHLGVGPVPGGAMATLSMSWEGWQ